MKVETVLKQTRRPVITIRPNSPLKHAADRLRMEGIAALVVMEKNTILGLVSEREIVHAFSRYGDRMSSMFVEDVMVDAVICAPEDDHRRIMALMTQRRVRHIPVLRDEQLVGIISIGDVVKYRLGELELEAGIMRDAYFAAH